MKKVSMILVILILVSLFATQFAFAQRVYRTPEPPGRLATRTIAGIIDLAGGTLHWKITLTGAIFSYSITKIVSDPPGIELDRGYLNTLIKNVTEDVNLRSDAAILEYIEKELYRRYPALKDAVQTEIDGLTGPGTRLRGAIESLLGRPITLDSPAADIGFLQAYKDKLKGGLSAFTIARRIELFHLPLKGVVGGYIHAYSGESFSILNALHSGTLSFFSEWANSLRALEMAASSAAAVGYVSGYVNTLTALKAPIQQHIYNNAAINIFSPLENVIVSYFADLKLSGLTDAQVNSRIAAFGTRMANIRGNAQLQSALATYAGGQVSDAMLSRFAAMTLGRSLSALGSKVLTAWMGTVLGREADAVLFDPVRTADKLRILREGMAKFGIDDAIFNLASDVIHDRPDDVKVSVIDWMVRLINDMPFVKGEFAKKFPGTVIDINIPLHEAILIDFATRIVDMIDLDGKTHTHAREIVAGDISEMTDNPFASQSAFGNSLVPPRPEEDAQGLLFSPVVVSEPAGWGIFN